MNNDGMVDFAYVADTGGNIYRINFTSGPATSYAALSSSDWTMSRIAYTNGAGRKFLFAPALMQTAGGLVYLAIGSGDREHPLITNYPYSDVVNRFYVFLNDVASSTEVNLDSSDVSYDYTTPSSCTTAGVLPSSGKIGWYMNLNQNGQGEQTVTSALIAGGLVTFSTNRPLPATEGSCENSLGEARGYWVNLLNGSGAVGVAGSCGGDRSTTFVGGGLPPSPVIGTVPIVVDGKSQPMTVIIGAPQRDGAASSPISPQRVRPVISSKRSMMYWKSSGDN